LTQQISELQKCFLNHSSGISLLQKERIKGYTDERETSEIKNRKENTYEN